MKFEQILKYIVIALLFVCISYLEGRLTNLPPSQQQLEYQSNYEEQSRKGSLTQREFEELKEKEAQLFNTPLEQSQLNHLLIFKAIFAIIFLIMSLLSYKFILKGTTIKQVFYICCICIAAIIWFVSAFELGVYVVFCAIGALLGYLYGRPNQVAVNGRN